MIENRLLAVYDFSSQPISLGDVFVFLQGAYLRSVRLEKEFVDLCFLCDFSAGVVDQNFAYIASSSNPFSHIYPLIAQAQLLPNLDSVFIVNKLTELGARYGASTFPDVNALLSKRYLYYEIHREMDWYYANFGNLPYLRSPENLRNWAVGFLREKSEGKFPITFNFRKNPDINPERNSRAQEWAKFIEAATAEFPVKFFLICGKSEIDPIFGESGHIVITKDFGTAVAEDLALIENSALHTGVASGPAQIAVFSERPFFITNANNLKSLEHYEGSLVYNGDYMRHSFGSEFQRLYPQDATAEFLLEKFREYWKAMKSNRFNFSKYAQSALATVEQHIGERTLQTNPPSPVIDSKGPLFSVLVPTYNQAQYLTETLDSIIAQSYPNWEAVVVNDGSTDATAEVMERYADRDPRICAFHKKNGGVSTALNVGLKNAKGDWICWLSSDDLFESNCLETYKKAIEDDPQIKFFHAQHYELLESKKEKVTPADRTPHIPSRELQTITFFGGNYVHGISVCGAREAFAAAGEFDEGLLFAQDVDMWMRISSRFETKFLSERVATTRIHDAATTSEFFEGGDYDYSRLLVNFLNERPFEEIFPNVDLTTGEGAGTAIRATLETALNVNAMAYKGNGHRPALLEKLAEWISNNCNEQLKAALSPQFASVYQFAERSGFPKPILDGLATLRAALRMPYRYVPFNPLNDFFEKFFEALKASDSSAAVPYAIYFTKINNKMPQKLAASFDYYTNLTELLSKLSIDYKTKSIRAKFVIPESAHAHKWLDGLKGIEVGPSSHNPFGLKTIFVGLDDSDYKDEQMRLTDRYAKLDIIAEADEIPLPDESQDFVLSSHVIEHCPNFIKTMIEWFRLIKKGGYIYMITPLRDSAPSDRGKPLTSWAHLFEDYRNVQTAEKEPDAGKFGHCHYHVFDVEEMKKFISNTFGDALSLVDSLERDDKDGLGFTLVFHKTKTNGETFPRNISSGENETVANIRETQQEKKRPTVNICMITYNRLEFTKRSIDSLRNIPAGADFTFTVIDNASVDGTREYLTELKETGAIQNLILLDGNVGVAKAANLGWSLVPEAKYFLKLDNDIVFKRENWLGEMLEAAEKLPEFGILGYNFEPVSYPVSIRNGIELREKTEGNLGGACFLVSPKTKETIGDFCEEYGPYGEEDADYCFRATLAGLRIAYMKDEDAAFHLPGGKAAAIDPVTFVADDEDELASHRQYRLWKDERRRENVAGGLFRSNLISYMRREKPLFQQSTFVKEFNSQAKPVGTVTPNVSGELVSIVIPVFNKLDLTKQCVESLYSVPAGEEFEVIIIDNASSDGTREYLVEQEKTLKNFRTIINAGNLGFAMASNQGIAAASGKYILLLNNDTIVTENWLGAMVAEARSDEKVGIVGSLLLYPDRETVQHAGVLVADNNGSLFPFHAFIFRKLAHATTATVSADMPAVTGACMLIKRGVIERCGPLDESYRNGYEDIDFCFKAAAAGFKTRYCGASRVIHYESMTPTRHDRDRENHEIFNNRWYGRIANGVDSLAVFPFLAEYSIRMQLRAKPDDANLKLGLIANCGSTMHPEELKEILAGFGVNGDSATFTAAQVEKAAAKFIEINVGK